LQLSKEGHGRNEIARLMTSQGLHISEGTVGNIVRAYRAREHGNSDVQLGVVPNSEVVTSLQMPDASISTGIHMNNTDGFSLLMARHGSNVIPRDGGPLSHLLGDNNTNHTSTDEEEVIPSVTSYSNSPSPVVLVPTSLIPPKPEPFSEPKPRDLFIIKDPETEMQVNIESNANVKYINQDVNSQNAAPK
jgi:hypothetical protein